MDKLGIAVLIVIAVMAAFQGITWILARKAKGRLISELDPSAAGLLNGREHALVYFYSPSCLPCRSMTPVIDELIEKYPERVIKVDVNDSPEEAAAFGGQPDQADCGGCKTPSNGLNVTITQ